MKLSLNSYKFLLYVVARYNRTFFVDFETTPYKVDIWDLSLMVAHGLLFLAAPSVYIVTPKGVEVVTQPYQDELYVSEERKKDA